jgi:hypothetical protein
MENATSRIMDHFRIRDSELPCLLFVNPIDINRRTLVKLSRSDTVGSVYNDVLGRVSDEFRDLESYWDEEQALRYQTRQINEWHSVVQTSPARIQELQTNLGEAHASMRRAQAALTAISLARTLEGRIEAAESFSADIFTEAENTRFLALRTALSQNLEIVAGLEPAPKTTNDPGFQEYRRAVNKSSKTRYSLRDLIKDVCVRLRPQCGRGVSYAIEENERETLALNKRLQEAHRGLAGPKGTPSAELERSVRARGDDLIERGYQLSVLRREGCFSFAVVEKLCQDDAIGVSLGSDKTHRYAELRILFLAANPVNTSHLDLEEELRSIEREVKGTELRARIKFLAKHAVRPDDLIDCVRTFRPSIIHFSGHGKTAGIALRDDAGGYHVVSGDSLRNFLMNRGVDVVVLNSCFSKNQADSIATAVRVVVGTEQELDDEAARRFSVAFYRSIGNGETVKDAFRDGVDAVGLYDLPNVYSIAGNSAIALLQGP